MAQIISQAAVCDGYDVRLLIGDQPHVLHLQREPAPEELATFIAELEDSLLAAKADQLQLEAIPTGDMFDGL